MSGPSLRSDAPILDLDDSTLQIGLDRALHLHGPAAAWREVLVRLDGRHTSAALRSVGQRAGLHPDAVSALIADLDSHGFLDEDSPSLPTSRHHGYDEQVWTSCRTVVAVLGDGPVADGIRAGLRAEDVETPPDDALAGVAADVATTPLLTLHPDLVVVTSSMLAVDRQLTGELVRAGIPHLCVHPSADGAVVGPLVLPGLTPCVHCQDLSRRDRQPSWVKVLPNVCRRPGRWSPTVTAWTIGTALVTIGCYLTGRTSNPPPVVELDGQDFTVSMRPWPHHPDCSCHLS